MSQSQRKQLMTVFKHKDQDHCQEGRIWGSDESRTLVKAMDWRRNTEGLSAPP